MKSVNELAEEYAKTTDPLSDYLTTTKRHSFAAGFNAAIKQLSQGSGVREFLIKNTTSSLRYFDSEIHELGGDETIDEDFNGATHVIEYSAYESKDLTIRKLEKENGMLREQRNEKDAFICKTAGLGEAHQKRRREEMDSEIKNEVEKLNE